jgi:hypothetical protein
VVGDETITVLLEPARFKNNQFNITVGDEVFAVDCAPQI